jgi:hypothetical protein
MKYYPVGGETAEVLIPFIKEFVNAGKGRGHYEMICQIMRVLFGHDIGESADSLAEPLLTAESIADDFIVDYLVDVLHEQGIVDFGSSGDDNEPDQFRHDGEADADALASAGMGTDEDYGYYGGGED